MGDFLKVTRSVCPSDQTGQMHGRMPTGSIQSVLFLPESRYTSECLKTVFIPTTTFSGRELLFIIPAP